MRTVHDLLADYLLTHELREETADYYRRMVSVLCSWAGQRVALDLFTPDLVNRLLLDKQRAGRSSSYRRTLRSAMRALLSYHTGGPINGKLRPVKLEPLIIEIWTAAEVQRLIDACEYMRDPYKRLWWKTIIAVGYYTGFSNCDLWTLRSADVDERGIASIRRSKTGKPVAQRIPQPWLMEVRALTGFRVLVFGRPMKKETFRQIFARVVRKAELNGSFKKLRKSCGTSIEMLYPGRGHIALGNTRAIFERHYFSRKGLDDNPMGPEELGRFPDSA